MNEHILRLAREHAPCYLYFYEALAAQATALHDAFPGFGVLFSVKANPFPPVVRALASLGIGADAASPNEVLLASSCGMKPEDIYFSAAGKSRKALETAWDRCHIIADSIGEVVRIGRLAAEKNRPCAVGIRVHPAFDMDGGAGGPSKFGICEEELPALRQAIASLPVTVCGLHVHLRSQNLDNGVLARYYESCFALALRVRDTLDCRLEYINFGGGVGIAYHGGQQPLNMAALRQAAERVSAENRRTLNARLLVESGRFLTAQAGTYFLPVVDKKISRGTTYVVLENCLNGFQKPALEAMLRQTAGGGPLTPQEPLFTGENAFPITALGDPARTETVELVGNLCCGTDVLCHGFTGPALEVGDLVAVGNTGAYARTLSPLLFSSHDGPEELLVDAAGNILS